MPHLWHLLWRCEEVKCTRTLMCTILQIPSRLPHQTPQTLSQAHSDSDTVRSYGHSLNETSRKENSLALVPKTQLLDNLSKSVFTSLLHSCQNIERTLTWWKMKLPWHKLAKESKTGVDFFNTFAKGCCKPFLDTKVVGEICWVDIALRSLTNLFELYTDRPTEGLEVINRQYCFNYIQITMETP